ncbi:MAG: imidazole glycerol phosphate synthase subunit HisH [Acidobacteriota bacterium]|nr:imidazole glycerol phosphate synthase subunit HisH [Acidobacteriota bacterium]
MNRREEVLVVPTGTANIASLLAALGRLGIRARREDDPAVIARAPRVVLPGVGTLGAARRALDRRRLAPALGARIAANRPTLAICLGLQLLGAGSDENPTVEGLGLWPQRATAFPPTVRAPQLGWNRIEPDPGCRLLEADHFYFAHTFRLTEAPPGWAAAWAHHGGRFVAALERGSTLACQFHPEVSSRAGKTLLERWLALPAGREGRPC